MDVPHWFSVEINRVLRKHRVEFEVRHGFIQVTDSDDPDDQTDRFIFKSARPEFIQSLVDSIKLSDD